MKHSEENWHALEKYLREEGPPPPGLAARLNRIEEESLPEHLDARVLREIRTAVAGEDDNSARPLRATSAVRRLVPAAAALLIVAGAAAWFASGVWQRQNAFAVRVLSAVGPIERNARELEIGDDGVLPPNSSLELRRGALLYLEYAPGFIVRLAGPAQFVLSDRGFTLQNGQVDLLAQESRPESGLPKDSSHASERDSVRKGRAEYTRVHEGFRLQTARAEYRLLGTCFRLGSGSEQDRLHVLEGEVAVNSKNGIAVQIRAGEGLHLSGPRAVQPETFSLTADDRQELDAMRVSLARFAGGTAGGEAFNERPDHQAGARAAVQLSIEDLRATYGSVMRFELRDGRSMVGSMVHTEAGDFIHTVDGMRPVQATDVLSFKLIE